MIDLNGARVLVTGGRGFTGIYLKKALEAQSAHVFNLVESDPGADEVAADLGNAEALDAAIAKVQPDFVIHLAAIANVAHSDEQAFYRVNVIGTTNLLSALAKLSARPKKVILASSANIYGNAEVSPVGEVTPPAPLNHYAMSKYAMELMAHNWETQFPIVRTRPFNYTGPGQSEAFLIPKIVGHFARRETEIRLGNLDVTREFNDVRMVAQAYVGLLQSGTPGEVYNICSGQGYSLRSVLDLATSISGHHITVSVDPKLVRPHELKVLIGDATRLKTCVAGLSDYRLEGTLRWMLAP